ncbi:MAG: signal peptidase I [Lachnospiraceae bacterium]|nr:signal peptidase I [Lachnospiraceae bacterium]
MDEKNLENDLSGQKTEKVESKAKEFVSMLFYIAIVFLITFLILHFVGQRTEVSGSSMEATLSDGDNLIMDKLTYQFTDPKRFDIVIFPVDDETYYIKRVIGLPGETVNIDLNGNIYINGTLLEEDYGLATIQDPGRAIEPITLGEDEYFVLGDNRNASLDSRYEEVGNIERDRIVGRAWLRIYPFNEITFLKNYKVNN